MDVRPRDSMAGRAGSSEADWDLSDRELDGRDRAAACIYCGGPACRCPAADHSAPE